MLCCLSILTACKKEDKGSSASYPSEVSFSYDGKTVACKVIRRDYTRGADGAELDKPISKLWLDRNLGAERAGLSFNDSLAAGDLFQWGRAADGHQKKNSDTTHSGAADKTPGHGKFIARSNDWLLTPDNTLWQAPANINCGCPEGWRLPTIEELMMEMYSWDTTNDRQRAFKSPLKWVTSGNRDGWGTVRYTQEWSFIQSSTVDGFNQVKNLAIVGALAEEITSPKCFGASVRCIRDL